MTKLGIWIDWRILSLYIYICIHIYIWKIKTLVLDQSATCPFLHWRVAAGGPFLPSCGSHSFTMHTELAALKYVPRNIYIYIDISCLGLRLRFGSLFFLQMDSIIFYLCIMHMHGSWSCSKDETWNGLLFADLACAYVKGRKSWFSLWYKLHYLSGSWKIIKLQNVHFDNRLHYKFRGER